MSKRKSFLKSLALCFGFIATTSIVSCSYMHSDQDLYYAQYTLEKEPFVDNTLKTNGYYYSYNQIGTHPYFNYYCFSKNGVSDYHSSINGLDDGDNYYLNGPYKGKYSKEMFTSGRFRIQQDTIWNERHERYYTGSMQPTYYTIGEILNDTTIHIYKYCSPNGSKSVDLNDTLHFRSVDAILNE
jgi:hypothetical protein